MEQTFLVRDFLEDTGRIQLNLRLVAGEKGLDREIRVGDINRPGLTLAGFFDFFAYDRIQIFGLGETAFMKAMNDEQRKEIYERFFSYDVNSCIFTHGVEPDEIFRECADRMGVAVFVTDRNTTRFISSIVHLLDEAFAPTQTLHGTLVDVFGVGVLILGKSGVGKSECALELVERGHRLVADDMVVMRVIDEALLMGSGSPVLKHHMEIRGIGIINIREIFGIRSVRNRKRIELVVMLEEWDSSKQYDRLGLEETCYSILNIHVPYIMVPVRPGRNIPIIVETAALNHRLRKLGINSAKELDENLQQWIQAESKNKKR